MLSILWIVLIVIASLVFSNVYWSCVLYTLCCQFSGLSLFWLPLWYSLTFIGPVSCIPYVVCCQFSVDCPLLLIASLVFSNVYLSCVLYTLCCQFSGLSLLWLPLWYSLTFMCPVSCIPYVVNSLDCPYCDCLFGILRLLVLCVVSMLSILWIVLIVIASLVFSNVYLSCVLYTLCCQFSGLSLLWLPLWYSLTFIGPVSCIPYVVNSLDCPYCDCLFGIL